MNGLSKNGNKRRKFFNGFGTIVNFSRLILKDAARRNLASAKVNDRWESSKTQRKPSISRIHSQWTRLNLPFTY